MRAPSGTGVARVRLRLDPRARAFVRRMPRTSVYTLAELALLLLLAAQCARLFWALFTPLGPLGDWRAPTGVVAGDPAQAARLRSFDPFFRLTGGSGEAATVTSLQLTLYGTRMDEATGRGSAILAAADGVQSSFAVGDEVQPGVVLVGVAFDNVTLSRGGAEEILYIDQSTPAPVADPGAAPVPQPFAAPAPTPAPAPVDPRRAPPPGVSIEALRRDVQLTARGDNGVTVNGTGGSPVLGQVGLSDGDVIVEAGGRPVGGSADVEAAVAGARPGGTISLVIERNGARVPVSVPVGR